MREWPENIGRARTTGRGDMATQSDGTERVRNYLLSQGEKYSFLELWVRVTQARLELLKAIEGVTGEQASFRPEKAEWSILEVVDHLVTSSGRVASLVEALANRRARAPGEVESPPDSSGLAIDEMRDLLLLGCPDGEAAGAAVL